VQVNRKRVAGHSTATVRRHYECKA
jgi:hypothetical protein